jgi:hypothetical protein
MSICIVLVRSILHVLTVIYMNCELGAGIPVIVLLSALRSLCLTSFIIRTSTVQLALQLKRCSPRFQLSLRIFRRYIT